MIKTAFLADWFLKKKLFIDICKDLDSHEIRPPPHCGPRTQRDLNLNEHEFTQHYSFSTQNLPLLF